MTSNKGKVAEASEYFANHGMIVKQFEFEATEPQTDDLEVVTISKLEQAISTLPNPDDMLLVEDAGLFVDALDGFPGVYSSYVLNTIGTHGILKLLDQLKSENPIQDSKLRSAEFRAVAALYCKGQTIISEGVCRGRISHQVRGDEGFGFDPIFVPTDLDVTGESLECGELGETSTHGKTFGEITLEEKQLYSHRRRALSGIIEGFSRIG
ncbi:MAG: non-canonical purine NTP pyrophosphatase [Candidatus Poseidoniaceae archaeon]|nr:non-canonical purine NTP pyrophosphatase [Candidatus Poseidoniaceae archaeon]